MTTMVKYWDRLKPEMDAAKPSIDITGLADKLKISFQAVAKVRDGGSFGSTNNLKAAKLFGLNPEWLATGKGAKYASNQGDPAHTTHEPSAHYKVVSLQSAVECVSQHLEALGQYDRATAISLLTTLANDPSMHEIVASGLKNLKPEARGAPLKQSSPAKSSSRAA